MSLGSLPTRLTASIPRSPRVGSPYLIICSIGNPEPEYEGTRHNVGHFVVEKLRQYYGFSDWYNNDLEKCKCALPTSSSTSPDLPVLFYKSGTYMNVSGAPLKKNYNLLKQYTESKGYVPVLVIVNDELGFKVGKVQLRKRKAGIRGHNGLRSIKQQLGDGNFLTINVGVDRCQSKDSRDVAEYVLNKTPREDLRRIEAECIPKIVTYIDEMLEGKHINELHNP